jgi:membrane protease YdiL (CAAX protease family)
MNLEPDPESPDPSADDLPPPGFLAPAMPDSGAADPAEPPRYSAVALLLGSLAWLVIVGAVVLAVLRVEEANATNAEAEDAKKLQLLQVRSQARSLIGTHEWTKRFAPQEQQFAGQAESLNAGPIDQRLRYVIVVGDIEGPEKALEALDQLDALVSRTEAELTPEQRFEIDALRSAYTAYKKEIFPPQLSDEERGKLIDQLDWFGKLALTPKQLSDGTSRAAVMRPAFRVAIVTLALVGCILCLGGIGLLGLLGMAILAAMDVVHSAIRCGRSPAGVYAETFALWLIAFESLAFVLPELPRGPVRMIVSVLLEFGSLGVLAWPLLRGLTWRQVRADLGLHFGRPTWAEPPLGIGCYVMGLPLLILGVIAALVLTSIANAFNTPTSPDDLVAPSVPSHPIMLPVIQGDWWVRLQVLFLASVVAPIVEEIMFRGVLYRHLRELTHRRHWWLSVFCSALLSSFLFAVIHPQGMLAVPMLMALAITFSLTREWRGTLIPCMVAHSLNNAVVLVINIAIMAD